MTSAPMSLSLETNVRNFLTKGNSLDCLQMAYRKTPSNGMPYLRGLMTGLAGFLRMQGHNRDEVHAGIGSALASITEGAVTLESMEAWCHMNDG